ncbi:hypothetical protein [Salinispora cortesiana]|uniref:hypothetical protein n=1 Tax=Salinispora cortesiana TaxID=1305843 RepID=UPI00046EEBBF|nr:hypothetical protein [Salinispora cortesiana]
MASVGGGFVTRVGGFVTTGVCQAAAIDGHVRAAGSRPGAEGIASPALGRFTQGLHVDRSMLDDYLMYVPDPPAAGVEGTAYRLSRRPA